MLEKVGQISLVSQQVLRQSTKSRLFANDLNQSSKSVTSTEIFH